MNRAKKVLALLEEKYTDKPHNEDAFHCLIGTMLSHRTKDEVTWPKTDELLKVYKNPKALAGADVKRIEKIIYPVGFYHVKARRVRNAARILVEKFGGRVPRARAELMSIPGVGGKTADCVLLFAFNKGVVPVDVHVEVVSKRLGFAEQNAKPEQVREELHKLYSPGERKKINFLMVQLGKEVCTTRRAYCSRCLLNEICPKIIQPNTRRT